MKEFKKLKCISESGLKKKLPSFINVILIETELRLFNIAKFIHTAKGVIINPHTS